MTASPPCARPPWTDCGPMGSSASRRSIPSRRRGRRGELAAGVALLMAGLGGCGDGGDGFAPAVVERPVAPRADAVNLTVEEAGHIASGELFAIYGIDADPVPVRVEAEVVDFDPQRVWQLDIVVEITSDGERDERVWRMWVGTAADGTPAVLRASELR